MIEKNTPEERCGRIAGFRRCGHTLRQHVPAGERACSCCPCIAWKPEPTADPPNPYREGTEEHDEIEALRAEVFRHTPAHAPVAGGVTDKNSTLQAVEPLADGGEIRCKECGGNGYLHDVAALRARVAELERVIEEAPHAHRCEREDQKWAGDFACNCFKSKAKVSG